MNAADREADDKLSVIELAHRYFRCLDAHDRDGLAACVTDDLEAVHSLFGTQKGKEAFLSVALAVASTLGDRIFIFEPAIDDVYVTQRMVYSYGHGTKVVGIRSMNNEHSRRQ